MPVFIFRFVVLSVLLYFGGWLGLKMAVPPGYASPIWPPSGLALASLLLWGRNLWPAVFLGSVANNLMVGLSLIGKATPESVVVALLIGFGSTLQTLIGVYLSRKWLQPGVPRLDSPAKILLFFLFTGPLSCLIAASIGVGSLLAFEMLPVNQIWVSWLNWWIGDSLGVLIVSPLLFCLFAEPRDLWGARRLRVALPLAVALLALVAVFVQVSRAENSRIQLVFDSQAVAIDRLLIEHADNAVDNSLALRDLFSAADDITRHEFAMFTRAILARHPEIQAMEWLPRIPHSALPEFERTIQSEGYTQFKVVERDAAGALVPVQQRDEYFPVAFVEPMRGNELAFGLDSTANPVSRESKLIASQSGKPTVSQRLLLVQLNDRVPAVLVSIPVFNTQTESVDRQLAGFVSAVVIPGRMVETALQGFDIQRFAISIRDLSVAPAEAELFDKRVADELNPKYGLKPWQHTFKFCDHDWQLTIVPDNAFLTMHGSTLPWLMLVGGLGFASLLSLLLLTISGRTAYIEALIDSRTAELRQTNAELKATERTLRESETRLRTLVQSQPECVKLLARDGSLLEMNPAGLAIIEADSLDQVKGQNLGPAVVLPNYQAAFADSIRRVFAGESVTLEFEINSLKGKHRWLDTHAVPMRDSEGKIVALLGITRDITQRKQAEANLKLAARVFVEAHEGILITDANAKIIDVNPTFCEITGYSREEVLGSNPRVLQSGKHSPEFYRDMWNTLVETRHWQGEVWNRKKNGDLYAELLTVSTLNDEQGNILYYVGLFSDITQSKQQQQMLELLAHYDPLTGLPNRTLFADRLLRAIAHSRRDASLLAICFLDLDGFKPVNDQFGHDAGDRVLIEVAERIKKSVREADSVSRHGGDEFTLLIGDLHSIEECEVAISRIHQSIVEPYFIDGQVVNIAASSGLTVFPIDDADPDTLLRHADHAMYQAKLAGKNRYQFFDASRDQQVIDRHNQLRDIEAAFDDQQFCLYFQPKVNIKTGQVMGVEALIRWLHPERGTVSPYEFLPVIASSELEIRIGNWVIEQAWQQLIAWHRQGLSLEVSVNISAYHLLWSGFSAHLETILAESPDIASRYLQLEILESTALDDLSAVNRVVRICRHALGTTSALDDFGTGYSSLTHLRHLPVDSVKIDKGFVRDMLDDPDDFAIVESVIGLSHAFRREVIAEGVENKDQGSVLLLMGCYLAQGFAIAKPMPAAELADWVLHYRPYDDWVDYANRELNAEQTQVAIRRIYARQWLKAIGGCLSTNLGSVSHWPIMTPNKSHFGRWIRQAKLHQLYDEQWLAQIDLLHWELLQKGNALMHQFWEGDVDAARAGFAELEAIQQRLDDRLSEYA